MNSVISANRYCLVEPPPQVRFTGFGESAVCCEVCIWIKSEEFTAAKNSIAGDLHEAFNTAGIDMPYPHTTLSNGAGDNALKVELVTNRSQGRPSILPESEKVQGRVM